MVNGVVDSNRPDSPWAGVGSLAVRGGTFTATLVAPDLALTAAHVVTGAGADEIVFTVNGDGDLAQRIPAADVVIHPGYRGVVGILPGGEYDLALVRLAAPAAPLISMHGLYEGEVPAGAIITFVGYGAAGDGAGGVTIEGNAAVKRVGHNVAECFAWTLGVENCGIAALTGLGPRALYLFDFDAPGSASALPTGEATLAGGDSGSPMFVRIGGGWRLAGVNTFVTLLKGRSQGVYGTAGGGVLLTHEHRLWIRSHVLPPPRASAPGPGGPRSQGLPAAAGAMLLAVGGLLAGCAAVVLPKRVAASWLRQLRRDRVCDTNR